MPAQHEILAHLSRIANETIELAVAWHALGVVALLALAFGLRPSRRVAGVALSLPLASVSVVAFAFGNPFNGGVFALLAAALAVLSFRGSSARATFGAGWAVAAGVAVATFGWAYPHFLPARSPFVYFYSAAMGTIPCPTLALVAGLTLIGDGLVGGAWRLTLAAATAFYSLFGVFRLGVTLDVVLFFAALALVAQHVTASVHQSAQAKLRHGRG